jgi:cytoskeletal protein CcmA (bactofilin family)
MLAARNVLKRSISEDAKCDLPQSFATATGGVEMALFNDESDKSLLEQRLAAAAKPQPAPVQTPLPAAQQPASQAALNPSGNRAYLDQGCEINGKLNFDGPVRIDGQIEGEINGQDSVMIGKSAVVTAKIKAVSIIVAGLVSGDLNASQRIELHPTAKVTGTITAPKLVIQEGALFEGSCTMQPKVVQDRKLVIPRKEERTPVMETNGNSHDRVGPA